MDIFIFSEFKNGNSVFVPCHTGSIPAKYGEPFGTNPVFEAETNVEFDVASFGSHANLDAPNKFMGTLKHSLYSNPV